jgi:hypothetical protein
LTQLHLLSAQKPIKTSQEEDCINILNSLLAKRINREESESSEPESTEIDMKNETDQNLLKINDTRKKYPFKQTYD